MGHGRVKHHHGQHRSCCYMGEGSGMRGGAGLERAKLGEGGVLLLLQQDYWK